MGGCSDKHFRDLLHAYELGMLTDEERRELELHLLECDSCMEEVKHLRATINTMRQSQDVRDSVEQMASETERAADTTESETIGIIRGWRMIVPTTLIAAVVILILILKPWHIEFRTDKEAIALQNRLAVMYFDNLASPDDSSRLGEIVTNLLISDLSESEYVQVVSEQRLYDILRLMGKEGVTEVSRETATEVAEHANANWMLLGDILQVEPEYILVGQLVETASGNVIASQRVSSGEDGDIFSAVDQLTVEIKRDMELPVAAQREPDRLIAEITTHSPEAYRQYLNGIHYFRKYYWIDARTCFEKAVEADSTFAMAYYFLAMLKDPGLIDKAVEYSDHASNIERHYIKSLKASAVGDKDLAIAELKELVKRYPDEKRAYYLMSSYAAGRRDYRESLENLHRAIEIDPMYKEAYNYLARVYSCLDSLDKAIWAINKYIDLAPDEANPLDTRGAIYAEHGDLDNAIKSYRKALEIKPEFYLSLSYLGIMHLFKREYAVAESCFSAYANLDEPTLRSSGRLYLSYIPIYRGRFNEALRTIDEYMAKGHEELPGREFPFLNGLKAYIYQTIGDLDSAVDEARKAVEGYRKNRPNDKENFIGLYIQLLAENGEIERAKEEASKLKNELEAGRFGMSSYWHAVGSIALNSEDPDSAVACFRRAAEEDTDFSTHYMLARAYLEAGMLSEAVAEFERQLYTYTSPRSYCGTQDVKMNYYLGIAYEESRWYDKAIERYEMFIEYWGNADPQIPEIEDARNRLAQLKHL